STGVNPESLTHAVVQQIHREDKDLAVADVATLEQLAAEPLEQPRMVMALLVSFAALAVILSALGIYSVLSYLIARRTHEIGVRLAFGARRVQVLGMVLNEGLRMTLCGVVIGLFGALAVTRIMASLLFGVRPNDPLTFAAVALLSSVVALLACFIPARRAMKVDPMVALRYE